MRTSRTIIDVRDCRFRYPDTAEECIVVPRFEIRAGEHLFIHGASGSGKSTFLNLLCGILEPDEGEIRVLDTHFGTLSRSERDRFRADHFGVVFQQFNLLPHLTVEQNILLGIAFSRRRKRRTQRPRQTVDDLLRRLDLPARIKGKTAMHLSVGQQQRVAVARALIGAPEILIADEPTSALDHASREDFMRLLFGQAEAHGSTLVFVSHDATLRSRFDRSIGFETLNGGGA